MSTESTGALANEPFLPLERMRQRLTIGRTDSDTTYFYDLLLFGELIVKLVVSAVVACLPDDTSRARYRLAHKLVRASGVGDWATALEDALGGPTSQLLPSEVQELVREITQKQPLGTWQSDSVARLEEALRILDIDAPAPGSAKIDLKKWFVLFARLRNKTRGHGAPTGATCARLCDPLEASCSLVANNLGFLRLDWAYLHRNLSGKYRVTILGGSGVPFAHLKSRTTENLRNGVYLHAARTHYVELVDSNVDASDFFLANGGFDDKSYELLSYSSGATQTHDSSPYLDSVGPLPGSETQGIQNLVAVGESWTNLPSLPASTVSRPTLEGELLGALSGDRYPVITLVGRGGIGKTSLALSAAYTLAQRPAFDLILWFSARDLDLLPEGPKNVRPAVVSLRDMADAFARLVDAAEAKQKGFKAEEYFCQALTKSPFGPTLFVFDNFETVSSPAELYRTVDTYVRLPNKILITTRQREFRGDYPITVSGMEEAEFRELVETCALQLKIAHLMTSDYFDDLFRESEGHPYVAKILLGEVAKAGRLRKVDRIVAESSEILTALFERTFAGLSPSAQRVFLTLSSWRTTLPKLALEAVLLRPENEAIAVRDAIDELERSSLIELVASEKDDQVFVTTPLAAFLYGRRKLAVSPMKAAIEADLELLHEFGSGQREDIRRGIEPRIARLVRAIAKRVESGAEPLERYLDMIKFIAQHYPSAWLMLSALQEEVGGPDGIRAAAESVRQFLADCSDDRQRFEGWHRVAALARRANDANGEVHALAELAVSPGVDRKDISVAASRLNQLLAEQRYAFEDDAKLVLVRKVERALRAHVKDADADDLSRLAWLELRLDNEKLALEFALKGLDLDPDNAHCSRLYDKLTRQTK